MNIKAFGVSAFGASEQLNIVSAGTSGNVYYAIQTSEAFYTDFYNNHFVTYTDGTNSIYNTIQGAIDATTNNRGDIVYVIGEWAISTAILLNKWGTTLRGYTTWKNQMGGGNSNITSSESSGAVINVTKAKTCIEDLVLYVNGAGAEPYGILYSGSAPSQSVVRNVCIIKNGGLNAEGIGIHFHTVPTRSLFENIFISGNTTGTVNFNQGIQGASYSCTYRNITIGRCYYQAIYNVGSSNDVFDGIVVQSTCGTGLEIGGTDGASSCIINSRNFATVVGATNCKTADYLKDGGSAAV